MIRLSNEPYNLFRHEGVYSTAERKQQRINEYINSSEEIQEFSQKLQDGLNHARSVIKSHTTEVQLLAASNSSLQALLKAEANL